MPFRTLLPAALACLLALSSGRMAHAQTGADLNLSPHRVVFDKERSASVYVFNQGDAAATYTIDLVDRVMDEAGQITAGAAPSESSAIPFLQYTPRRVTLQPHESQVIRLRLRPPGGGRSEYRTHLTVTAVPLETAGLTAEAASAGRIEDLSLNVIALFSMSIPVIVRDGPSDFRASIENLVRLPAHEGAPNGSLTLDLVRLGASSVFGDIEVRAGNEVVARVRGVAVYPEIARRTISLLLARPVEADAVLRVAYLDDDARPGSVLATGAAASPVP